MIPLILTALTALTAPSVTPNDTLQLQRAELCGAYPVFPTYTTDSTNLSGQTPDLRELLKRNKHLLQPGQRATTDSISSGEALTVGSDSLPVLRKLRFTVQTPRFVEGSFTIGHLANYVLYVGGEECSDKRFALTPGRTEVTLLALTQKGDRDTLSISVTGKALNGVVLNAGGKRPYTMTDMVMGAHYGGARLSPTGKYLLTYTYYTQPDGKAPYKTRLTERATGRTLRLWDSYVRATWQEGVADVLWFDRKGDKGRELVRYTPADGNETTVSDNLPEGNYRLSPRADYLIFSVTDDGPKPQGALKSLKEPDDRQPGWRDRNALWRYDLKSGLMQRLTFGQAGAYLADISADGHKLLVQYSRFDAHRQPFDRTTLVSIDAYTGRTDMLLADTTYIAGAQYSPDGSKLLVQASPASFGGLGSEAKPGQTPNMFDYRLYLYDPSNHTTTPLLKHFAPSVESYEWAGSEKAPIYFSTTEGHDRTLYALDVASGKLTRYALPVTYVQGFSVAHASGKAAQAVVWGQSGTRARELFDLQLSSATPKARRIGEIDFDQLTADIALGTCHNWKFESSRGDSIDGFYFLPPDFDASKRYPVIVYYYGGCVPTSQCLEYQYPLQVLAGQGYVVYALNPSGATGYGQEFAARHVNTWGMGSADDIIEGTKAFCQAHPFADATKVGCMGASYGGFMTEYLQTRTDIFAAAVSHAGISNIASYWGGGYWGYSYGECAQFGSYPWNNPDLYVKQSALFNADKIHTPLLLLHGTADTNVPTTESQQLFTALKILGRDVAFIQVDGENHVITNLPKRLQWQNAIFAWFARYLKGDDTWWKSLKL